MKKKANIYVTITNNVVNFKTRLPWLWCEAIGITKDDRSIYIKYENDKLIIEKSQKILFSDLSSEEKSLQIHKYVEYLNRAINEKKVELSRKFKFMDKEELEDFMESNEYKNIFYPKQKDIIKKVEKYFKITYRTAYRHLEKKITSEQLKEVELLEEQNENDRNINLMIKDGKESATATLTIPSSLAILFLQGKKSEELGIKNNIEIYSKNTTLPIKLSYAKDRIIINNIDISVDDEVQDNSCINSEIESEKKEFSFDDLFSKWE